MSKHSYDFDVIVVGAGVGAQRLAGLAQEKNARVAMVGCADNADRARDQWLQSAWDQPLRTPSTALSPAWTGAPRFLDAHRLSMGDTLVSSARFVIATGATPLSTGEQPSSLSLDADLEAFLKKQGHALLSLSFLPNTQRLDLPKAGVGVNKHGGVRVDESCRTSAPHIWAIGGAVDPFMPWSLELQHVETVAHNLNAVFFDIKRLEPLPEPRIFSGTPPVAVLGRTEQEARQDHRDIRTSVIERDGRFLKIIGRERTGKFVGAHIAAPEAAELILFFSLLIRADIPLGDIAERRYFPSPSATDIAYEALRDWEKTS